ncbi:MAG: recombinase family protein [Clostridiales bacterium]|nr:recombinase family protein [Clostridiales bacterium]
MDKEKIRIAIYVRKCTYSNFSIEQYEEIVRCKKDASVKYADRKIEYIEYVDIHYPEMNRGRLKGINKLVDDIKGDSIDVIYTYSVHELVNNAIELKAFLDLILKKGIDFISLDENPIDTHNTVFPIMRVCVNTIANMESKCEEQKRYNLNTKNSKIVQKGTNRRRALL